MSNVGVIGCGAMGKGMVKNLVTKGYTVHVYDSHAPSMEWCSTIGAVPMASPGAVAKLSDVVLTSLPGPEIVKNVLLGDNGVLESLRPNGYIVDMSTIDPATSQEMYREAKEKGIHFYDCPVSGGPMGADAGTLTIMVGGDENDLPQVRPVLEAVGTNIFYLGESGSGQVAKLCHNMLVAAITVGIGEAFTVGAKAGLAPHKLAEVMDSGSAHNRVLSIFGPNMLQGTYEDVKFSLNHMHKDVSLYAKMASNCGVPSLVGSLVQQIYETAKSNGKGHLDSSAVCLTTQELANISIEKMLV
jgi:3-hydroxyisobutyrate dehydrogenase